MANYSKLKAVLIATLVLGLNVPYDTAKAAVREGGGNTLIINKLQNMVREISAERDLLKTGSDKMAAELVLLKKDLEKLNTEKTTVLASEKRLASELSMQKNTNTGIRDRLDQTTATLHEAIAKLQGTNDQLHDVIDRYNALSKTCTELDAEFGVLDNKQKFTAAELKTCESKNLKMYESAEEVIGGYKGCKNRNILDTLIESEPFFKIKNVEAETQIQEYEDKLRKHKYQAKKIPDEMPPADVAPEELKQDEGKPEAVNQGEVKPVDAPQADIKKNAVKQDVAKPNVGNRAQ